MSTTAKEYSSIHSLTDEDKAILTDLQTRLGSHLEHHQDRIVMDERTKRGMIAQPVCPECGSSDFYNADGSCYWDMGAQDWLVSDMYYQRGFCGDCDYESYSETVYYKREDVDGINADRERWAEAAIQEFRRAVGTDYEDALGDLLCDLMHWAHLNEFSFNQHLDRARGHYAAEILGERVTRPIGTPVKEAAA